MPSSKTLVIVESPTKAKTIGKFLSDEYEVMASFGHVRDLPKSKIGIDVKNNFTPTYAISLKAKDHVAELQREAARAREVILATDEDREGEAIAWHLVQALDLEGEKRDTKSVKKGRAIKSASSTSAMRHAAYASNIKRIVFHEITKPAILEALANPRTLDMNLVDAQQARRVLDRLVGYELSPFLWRKIRYGLSAGRVQSVAVRLVVEREREIQAFRPEEYWSIDALFKTKKGEEFEAHLSKIGGKSVGKMDINSGAKANEILAALKDSSYHIAEIETKQATRSPAAPFTTSTLQQEAARKLGFSAKQTMVIAQQLYEHGHITYMRTDSVNLAASALKEAHEVIGEHFGKKYQLADPRHYATKSKGAQEAHEAVRPTHLATTAADFSSSDRGQKRLYDLIWRRTIASQMALAQVEQTALDIQASSQKSPDTGHLTPDTTHTFRASGQVILFDGFLRAYTEGRDEDEDAETEGVLPAVVKDEPISLSAITPNQHFTEPRPRYTDATLVKALELHGIGRPSTYAPTLATIQDRGYVEKIDKKYAPTEIGFLVNDVLVEHFPEIVDLNFTSHIEEELDDIAEGKINWVEVCREFYDPFKKHLIEKEKTVEKHEEVSTTPCPHCGKMMMMKFGRFGKFLACPDPEVKVTLPMPEEAAKIKELEEKTRGELCPLCEKPMKIQRGRFGFFLGCVDYPKCKGIMKIWNKTGFKCPECARRNAEGEKQKEKTKEKEDAGLNSSAPSALGVAHSALSSLPSTPILPRDPIGDIVEKKGRGRGKPFWACTRYPECELVMNKKPESEAELAELYEAWKNKPKTEAGKKYPRGKLKKKESA